MTRRLFDISPRISPELDPWEGDTRFSTRRVMAIDDGCSVNVTTVTTTVQLGAHVDTPLHFTRDGADAAGVPLEPYLGPARVVRLPRERGVSRDDVAALDLSGVERLLLHTRASRGPARFRDGFSYLEPAAAELLASRGLRLLGIDSFSVDEQTSKSLGSHHALHRGGCVILEGIVLDDVPPGDYELIALPLPLAGCDGSPVRAVLREL